VISCCLKAQETQIRFFGQPGVEQTYNPKYDKNAVYFRGGPMIIYVTSQINEKISVAAELNPHYNAVEGPQVEIERIFAKYYFKDFLSFRIGRMYNPIGFWNTNYNFGLILQPTISRPQILEPLHDEGFTQTRDAGFQIEGNALGKARFFYKLMIGNGIGKYGGTGGVSYLLGQNMGYTGSIGIEPVEGLKVMMSGYFNKMQKGMITNFNDTLSEDYNYSIVNASLIYINPEKKFEFISEAFIHNYNAQQSPNKNIKAAYIYAGYKLSEKFIPYLFGEITVFDDNIAFFKTAQQQQILETRKAINIGARYRFDPNAILKFEYEFSYGKRSELSFGPRLQFAFGF
jgi:hypothetical protein